MLNKVAIEGTIDNDLTIQETANGKQMGIGSLFYFTGSGDYQRKNKITLFFRDSAFHNALKNATTKKLKAGSRVIIEGYLNNPAEVKQGDGTYAKPKDSKGKPIDASIDVTGIEFATIPGSAKKTGDTESTSSTVTTPGANPYAPKDLPPQNAVQASDTKMPPVPAEPYEDSLEIKDGSDLPF